VALFAGLTAGLTATERHRTALRAVIYANITLVAAATTGQVI
jgi:small neutral amino acid transporter SnatA (MarC family)